MITTREDDFYESVMDDVQDCDGDPATITVTASPEEFGTCVQVEVAAWERTATAYLTPQHVGALIDILNAAVRYATTTPDRDR